MSRRLFDAAMVPSLVAWGPIRDRFTIFALILSAIVSFDAVMVQAQSISEADKGANEQGSPTHPHVLFIAIDDLNDWPSFLNGHPSLETPHLDALAGRGLVFDRAYCASPSCNPSRTALLTGLRPTTTGVYTNRDPWREVLPDVVTLPEHFSKAGYRVLGGGKIFHGRFKEPKAWDEYFATGPSPKPKVRPANGIPKAGHFDWAPLPVGDEAMPDTRLVDWASAILADPPADRPLFLAVGLFRPHLPWYVPEEHFNAFPLDHVALPRVISDDLSDLPASAVAMANSQGDHRRVLRSDNWSRAVQGYLASIRFVDRQVGRLIEALDDSPIADSTVVVLWGDHGWHLGEKEHWRKFTLWEEASRVPLIIVAPGIATPGRRTGKTVSLLDVYPTLVDLCNLPARPGLEGRSLVPLLRAPMAPWSEDRPVLTTYRPGNHAVRSERWRYIRYRDGSEELYDHESDPYEWTNRAGEAQFADVKADLRRWLPKSEAEPATRRVVARTPDRAQLEP